MRFVGVEPDGSDRRWQWSGSTDLLRVRSSRNFVLNDPSAFRAEGRQLAGAGVTLAEWRSSQLAGEWVPVRRAGDLEVFVVLAGSVEFSGTCGGWTAAPQDVVVLRDDEARRWRMARGTHLRGLYAPAVLLPAHLRATASCPSGLLQRTKLARAFAAALVQGVDAAVDVDHVPVHLARGLLSLAVAAADDLAPRSALDAMELREQIVHHIDRHLAEPTLGPRTIADAFGVSLRWVHRCFNEGDMTVARFIRIRRVDGVAEHLRHESRQPRLGVLALQFGYSGRDQLARVFRGRYGVTVAEFHRLAREGAAPRPVGDPDEEQVA